MRSRRRLGCEPRHWAVEEQARQSVLRRLCSMVVRADKTWWETGEARNIVDQMVEGQKCWALGCGDGVRVRASLGFLTGQFRALRMPSQVYQ